MASSLKFLEWKFSPISLFLVFSLTVLFFIELSSSHFEALVISLCLALYLNSLWERYDNKNIHPELKMSFKEKILNLFSFPQSSKGQKRLLYAIIGFVVSFIPLTLGLLGFSHEAQKVFFLFLVFIWSIVFMIDNIYRYRTEGRAGHLIFSHFAFYILVGSLLLI